MRGCFAAFTRGRILAGRLLVVSGCRALRIHSLKMAVEGHGTSYHLGLSSFHLGPGMGPSLVNVQLEGGVAYLRATAGDYHPPQIWMRCSGMESDCNCAAPNLRHECQCMVRQRHPSACSSDSNAAAR